MIKFLKTVFKHLQFIIQAPRRLVLSEEGNKVVIQKRTVSEPKRGVIEVTWETTKDSDVIVSRVVSVAKKKQKKNYAGIMSFDADMLDELFKAISDERKKRIEEDQNKFLEVFKDS